MAEDGLPTSFPALFPRGEQMETVSRDGAGNILFFEKPTRCEKRRAKNKVESVEPEVTRLQQKPDKGRLYIKYLINVR